MLLFDLLNQIKQYIMKTNITVMALIALVFSTSLKGQNSIDKGSERLQELQDVFSITEKNICNPAFVTGEEWKQFKQDMNGFIEDDTKKRFDALKDL